MDLMLQILLGLVAVGIAGYPLAREQWFDDDEEEELSAETEDLVRRKESAYAALKELEFDYRTGKLSDLDYRELEAKYKDEAFDALEELDGETVESHPKEAAGVDQARRGAGVDDETERPRTPKRAGKAELCPQCSIPVRADQRFCSDCGELIHV